ncbi:MAG: accessory gene regulator B family protein [Thermotaleaceae bacterium]
MERLAQNLTNLIHCNKPELSDLEIKKIKFGLECFLGETSKFLLYLMIFGFFSLTKEFLLATVFFCVPRTYAGGFHADTYWSCFFTSLAILSSIIVIGSNVVFVLDMKYILILLTFILVWIYAPVDHPNKPIISEQRRKNLKYVSLAIVTLFTGISFVVSVEYGGIATVALFVEALSLPIGEFAKRRYTNETTNR